MNDVFCLPILHSFTAKRMLKDLVQTADGPLRVYLTKHDVYIFFKIIPNVSDPVLNSFDLFCKPENKCVCE